jgi:hypothetical protein
LILGGIDAGGVLWFIVLTFLAVMSFGVAVVLSFLGLSVRNIKDKERAQLRERTDPHAAFSTDCKIFTLIFGDHDGILLGYDDRIELVTMKLKKKPIMLDKITEIEDLGVDLEDPDLHSIPRKIHLFALWTGPISVNKLAVIDGRGFLAYLKNSSAADRIQKPKGEK